MNIKPDWMKRFRLTPDNPPNDGILFADLEAQDRSSHMGHALVEYAPGCILGFYPNCDSDNDGHSGNGWMEYRRTEDGGKTWSDAVPLPYSKQLYDAHTGRTAMCEKAVLAGNGQIILFMLHCDMKTAHPPWGASLWEPYFEPALVTSRDGGRTWSGPKPFISERGRVYDVCYKDGRLYVLFLNNPFFPDAKYSDKYHYQLYVSADNGETFEIRSRPAFQSTVNCYYGTMGFLVDGSLIVYSYDEKDEHNLKYIISVDEGYTWQTPRRAHFAKRIRNPQFAYFGGEYFIHGRNGNVGEQSRNFILYHSLDGICWDEGTYLRMREAGIGYYSNNIVVGSRFPDERQRLLIHASHAYKKHQTNTVMWWLDCLK